MTNRERWLLIAGACVVVIAGVWSWNHHAAPAIRPTESISAQPRVFSASEVKAFLAAARQAETISDPLQRCLRYPDPPGSHWSPAAVEAYCRYRTQPMITFEAMRRLIQGGQAARLDHLLSDALQAQRTRPGSPGLLDHIYHDAFEQSSFDVRQTLDAWKRQSPESAFAYAASGMSYVAMAQAARGRHYVRDTSQAQFDAMDRLLIQATGDLDRAVQLDPRLTPAYTAMIYAGGLGGNTKYAIAAARRGLAIDPSNYSIYGQLLWLAQPEWAGSIDTMRSLTAQARLHAKANPLLSLLQPLAPSVEIGLYACGCNPSPPQPLAVRRVLDQAAGYDLLYGATREADRADETGMAVIYASEVLRFDPTLLKAVTRRSNVLVDLGYSKWALAEADRAIDMAPQNPLGFDARAYAHKTMHDYADAERIVAPR